MPFCLQLTRVFILSTLGLFDFSVVQVPNANQYRLAETGTSQRHLSRFEAVGLHRITDSNDKPLPIYMYREEDGVKKYVKVGDSNSDYRLTVTTSETERSIFMSERVGDRYTITYNNPSASEKWYLQGVFPIVNGSVNYQQAYARVGEKSAHYNINGNIVPLSAIPISTTCGKQSLTSNGVVVPC